MKYKELLELYKQGKLEEEKRKKVEQDIEKHEAISDYLFEEEIPGFENIAFSENGAESQKGDKDDIDIRFAKMVRRSIRWAFIKAGVAVVAIVLVIVFLAQSMLPDMISSRYYKPDKIVKGQTTQFELDMAVYTELFVPEQKRERATIQDNGYGNYQFNILQTSSITGNFNDVAGSINKGEIIFYNTNILKRFTGNAFVRTFSLNKDLDKSLTEQIKDTDVIYSAAGDRKIAKEVIEELAKDKYYNAYVSLDKVMDYDDFIKFIDKTGYEGVLWCAPIVSDGDHAQDNDLGFFYDQGTMYNIEWDEEKYPILQLWEMDEKQGGMKNTENATQHFTDMLAYMIEQEDFCNMMGISKEDLEAMKNYIEKNGLKIHGFMIEAQKEEIEKMFDKDEVFIIYTTEVK